MDWTKAKTILIIALILTNIVLSVNLFIDKSEEELISKQTIADTLKILWDREIYVFCEVPNTIEELPVLNVEYDHIDSKAIDEMIENQDTVKQYNLTKEEVVKIAEDFLNQNNLLNENTKLEPIKKEGNEYTLIYKNYYKDTLLEECSMICVIKNGKIVSIDRIWLKPIDEGPTKKRTIPATTALLKFASLREGQEKFTSITDISLVYWLKTSLYSRETTTKDTARPAWRIYYDDGETEYILAYEN
ncbi:MAG: two-component system regulatory protein YycI [Clostridia bacterium]|nr:two-component system regulatory protein YycI [Clostridia bacterium]